MYVRVGSTWLLKSIKEGISVVCYAIELRIEVEPHGLDIGREVSFFPSILPAEFHTLRLHSETEHSLESLRLGIGIPLQCGPGFSRTDVGKSSDPAFRMETVEGPAIVLAVTSS